MANAAGYQIDINNVNQVPSVAQIKDINAQCIEIERRLADANAQLNKQGIGLTPIMIMVVLGIDDNTYAKYRDGQVEHRVEGKVISVDAGEDNKLTDEEKGKYLRRRAIIKKYLQLGEAFITNNIQGKPNNLNGGLIRIGAAVYKITEKDERSEQAFISLEDLMAAAAGAINKAREPGNT